MKIKFLGATESVTGSKYLVKGENHNLLIDCGLYQGIDSESYNKITYQILKHERINAIVLTHAHLDHSGFLPKLVKDGFKGPIFATKATKDLTEIILEDNASIQITEIKKINEKIKKDKNKLSALYEKIHVKQTMGLFQIKDFNNVFHFKEFEIEFKKAGHILGAISPIIKSANKVIEFSGDLGRSDDLTMYAPTAPLKNLDALVMESTYGDRLHLKDDYVEFLANIIKEVKNKQATLIIPAFSVGRSQTLMLVLYQLFEKFPNLDTKVYIDSPMTQKVTRVYHNYPQLHKIDIELLKNIEAKFHFVKFQSEKDQLDLPGHKIILTAAGMLSGGNVLRHLQNHATNSDNTLLIVGFQSPGTIGRHLLQDKRKIFLNNQNITITAKIYYMPHLSSHPDQSQLLNWCEGLNCKNIYLTHGENNAKVELKKKLKKLIDAKVHIPSSSTEVTI